MADAMSMESNRTEEDPISIPEEQIKIYLDENPDATREQAINALEEQEIEKFRASLARANKAEEGESAIMEQPKASGGYVKKYSYGGRVAKSSAEKS